LCATSVSSLPLWWLSAKQLTIETRGHRGCTAKTKLRQALPEKYSNYFAGLKARKFFSRKGAKRVFKTRQRFAPLRLCVRNLLHTGTFRAKPLRHRPLAPIIDNASPAGVKVTATGPKTISPDFSNYLQEAFKMDSDRPDVAKSGRTFDSAYSFSFSIAIGLV